MATRFEVVLWGEDPVALRAAAEEALDEVRRWDRLLSLYEPASEISQVNAWAHREPVHVSPAVFRLLEQARRLHQESGGAFDITVAPLLRCWGLMRGSGRVPTREELTEARSRVGTDLVQLDATGWTVGFAREGVMLDLGAIGKGHAVDQAAHLLREAGVTSAFLHGGTSSMVALGCPPGQDSWNVTLELHPLGSAAAPLTPSLPAAAAGAAASDPGSARTAADSMPVALACLRDESLSVSAVSGKAFVAEGRTYGHIMDPRTGAPATRAVLAAVVLPSAAESDALSTALLTLGSAGHALLASMRPGIKTFTVRDGDRGPVTEGHGLAALGQFSVEKNGLPP
jgi:FAD:protein FMN transferase